ncbi:MAG: hypothetical protein J6W16_00885 [Methanobrevibacter sp.]|nr:hypothetical protein [Methanobrevibacter sp.]
MFSCFVLAVFVLVGALDHVEKPPPNPVPNGELPIQALNPVLICQNAISI